MKYLIKAVVGENLLATGINEGTSINACICGFQWMVANNGYEDSHIIDVTSVPDDDDTYGPIIEMAVL